MLLRILLISTDSSEHFEYSVLWIDRMINESIELRRSFIHTLSKSR